MSSTTHAVEIIDPHLPGLRIGLTLPESWTAPEGLDDLRPEIIAVFSDNGELISGFSTNVVVISQELPEGLELENWQKQARTQQLATLPDLQILDDRSLTGEQAPTWYCAHTTTGQEASTLLVRQWSRIVAGRGLTLTLTTVPMVDASHADLLDSIARSWTTGVEGSAA